MEQKIKFIIIGLIAFLVISIFTNLQTLNSKAAIQREKERLSKENTGLNEKLDKVSRDYQRLDEKAGLLTKDLEKAGKEKEDIQVKYDALTKLKDELEERVKSLQFKSVAKSEPASFEPQDSYWAGILKTKTTLELQLDNIKSELKTLQINNEQLQREKSSLEVEINNLGFERQDLKRQLEYSQKQLVYNQKIVDNVTLELVGEKNDKSQITDTFRALKNENLVLRRQLKNLSSRKVNLDKKIQGLQEDNARFEKRFSEMDVLLKDRLLQIDSLKKQTSAVVTADDGLRNSSVELPTIVVRPQKESAGTGAVSATGRVLAINKENNFVVIDAGQDAGIKIGNAFNITRGSNVIATVEVIQVRKAISACDIKKEISPIQIGDSVSR
ncbi:MAG: hypothetical protein MUC39_00700 [Candidatus Omnitrophica bacterium]|jgi:chromosome segregation ATPase|nr:hypothetical protein [Candidatus Omnitrophota bacterium]